MKGSPPGDWPNNSIGRREHMRRATSISTTPPPIAGSVRQAEAGAGTDRRRTRMPPAREAIRHSRRMIAAGASRGTSLQRADEDRDVAERIADDQQQHDAETKLASISRSRFAVSPARAVQPARSEDALRRAACRPDGVEAAKRRVEERRQRRGWPAAQRRRCEPCAHARTPASPARSARPAPAPPLLVDSPIAGGDDEHGARRSAGTEHKRLGDPPASMRAHRRLLRCRSRHRHSTTRLSMASASRAACTRRAEAGRFEDGVGIGRARPARRCRRTPALVQVRRSR